jgi:hypothetical protein
MNKSYRSVWVQLARSGLAQLGRLSPIIELIDDGVENVDPPQIAPSPAPAKDLRF